MLKRASLGGIVVYLLVFIFIYAPPDVSFIPVPDARGVVGGFVDGIFMLPIFLLEVVDKYIHNFGAVPQMFRVPNHGISYHFGYLIGAILLWGSVVVGVPLPRRRSGRRRIVV